MLFIVFGALLVGAVVVVVRKGNKKAESRTRPAAARPRFRSVELVAGRRACAAAQALASRVLLATDAPVLPLEDCDAKQCSCAYKRHDDRRQTNRRRGDDGLPEDFIYGGEENRWSDDRRDDG